MTFDVNIGRVDIEVWRRRRRWQDWSCWLATAETHLKFDSRSRKRSNYCENEKKTRKIHEIIILFYRRNFRLEIYCAQLIKQPNVGLMQTLKHTKYFITFVLNEIINLFCAKKINSHDKKEQKKIKIKPISFHYYVFYFSSCVRMSWPSSIKIFWHSP